jgi:hypothetical protein
MRKKRILSFGFTNWKGNESKEEWAPASRRGRWGSPRPWSAAPSQYGQYSDSHLQHIDTRSDTPQLLSDSVPDPLDLIRSRIRSYMYWSLDLQIMTIFFQTIFIILTGIRLNIDSEKILIHFSYIYFLINLFLQKKERLK